MVFAEFVYPINTCWSNDALKPNTFQVAFSACVHLVRMQHVVLRMMDYAMQTTLKAAINYFKINTNALAYFV